MLQIITGKFFESDDCYVTRQRTVLYSNYRTHRDVETAAGALRISDARRDVATVIYEVDQRIEKPAGQGGFGLVATTPEPLADDFAAVVSFVLDVTCTADAELARRLTQSNDGALGVPHAPGKYVSRVFDSRVDCVRGDGERLQAFVNSLVALERASFEAAIKAIRRYVTGLHRIGDDLDLAYTLLVASVESLAQEFDAFTPKWTDFPQEKRFRIDKALAGVEPVAADAVRASLLKDEHLANRRRYREFVLAHIGPEFFREQARGRVQPARRSDLEKGLGLAYDFRSKYVHTLRELPRVLTSLAWERETFRVGGVPALTFRGLARVARTVILAFIERSPRKEHEAFDWRSALPGTVSVEVGERYWIWKTERFDHTSAGQYLNGFLNEMANALTEREGAFTDIRDVLGEVERQAPGLTRERRRSMLTLYVLYHRIMTDETWHRPGWAAFVEGFSADFDPPSLESLLAHALLGEAFPWPAGERARLWEAYREQRYHKHGLRAPALIEGILALRLAEMARQEGDREQMLALVTTAVDQVPGHEALIALEVSLAAGADEPITWRTLLLESAPVTAASQEAASLPRVVADSDPVRTLEDARERA